MAKIYQIYGQDAHDMTIRLLEASEAIRLAPSGVSVALKPNLVVAGTPENGATTHAGVLSGCIEYFKAHGVREISVIEGSRLSGRIGGIKQQRQGDKNPCRKLYRVLFDRGEGVLLRQPFGA